MVSLKNMQDQECCIVHDVYHIFTIVWYFDQVPKRKHNTNLKLDSWCFHILTIWFPCLQKILCTLSKLYVHMHSFLKYHGNTIEWRVHDYLSKDDILYKLRNIYFPQEITNYRCFLNMKCYLCNFNVQIS